MRQAKLYYIRDKVAREIKRQMRRMMLVNLATESDIESTQKAELAAKEAEAKAAAAVEEESEADSNPEDADNTETRAQPADESDKTETDVADGAKETTTETTYTKTAEPASDIAADSEDKKN